MSEPTTDYGYDLVHEHAATPPPAMPRQQQPVFAVTETSDQDEDLSYDLAHDVPK